MKRLSIVALILCGGLLLTGCGPTHHVFPPEISVQQLQVDANGQWNLTVRMQNYSYDASVHFDHVRAELRIGDQPAGTLDMHPDLDVAQQNADVASTSITPNAAASHALSAITRANGSVHSVAYTLNGTVTVTGEGSKRSGEFKVQHHGWLSPVPGVANTYR